MLMLSHLHEITSTKSLNEAMYLGCSVLLLYLDLREKFLFRQALSIVSVSLLAVESFSDISPLFLTGLLEVQL